MAAKSSSKKKRSAAAAAAENLEVNEILSQELTWSDKQFFKDLGIFSAGELDDSPAWQLRRELQNTAIDDPNPDQEATTPGKSSKTDSPCNDHDVGTLAESSGSKKAVEEKHIESRKVNRTSENLGRKNKKQEKNRPRRLVALRKEFVKQRKFLYSNNNEKETEDDDTKNTLSSSNSSIASIVSSGKRKISSIMTSFPEDEDFRASKKAEIDPLMKERLKEKNMGAIIKSKQCCGVIGSSSIMTNSPEDADFRVSKKTAPMATQKSRHPKTEEKIGMIKTLLMKTEANPNPIITQLCRSVESSFVSSHKESSAKPLTTAALKKPPRRDNPKKLVQQEENLPNKVEQEDPEETRRKEREASRRAFELMERTVQVEDNFKLMADFERLTGCSVYKGFGPEMGLRQLKTGKVFRPLDFVDVVMKQEFKGSDDYYSDESSFSSCVTEELEEGEIF